MPHKIEISTGTVASAAATSPAWLPSAEQNVELLGHARAANIQTQE